MSADRRLKVVLCWHMHQPQYRDLVSGQYRLPWTYLHAVKDYVDMAAHLESVPGARAVVNFAPILLEQIDDYARQVAAYLERARPIDDPILGSLAPIQGLPQEPRARRDLAQACVRVNAQHGIRPFRDFRLLAEWVDTLEEQPHVIDYLSDQFLTDLVVWYHLAWLGETVRREDERVKSLMEKGHSFSNADRQVLLEVIGEQLDGVIGRYRRLAEEGRIELSMSPYAHPIMPLLLDIGSAFEATPEIQLPGRCLYPRGEERVRWHIERGRQVFRDFFGFDPSGCWPSEGGVSTRTLGILGEYGFRWTASGETVLANSLRDLKVSHPTSDKDWLYRPYHVDSANIACVFRDDGLSDAIGFRYATWHADDAVGDFIHHLENIARARDHDPNALVSVILDGENAWEYYPANGYYFLSALYRRLADHPEIELTTFSEALGAIEPANIPRVTAGSWVFGTFTTWIGDPEKNQGWQMLCRAKSIFDRVMDQGRLDGTRRQQAIEQLAVCEGSDWCWWFGEYNPAASVTDFDRLYREHLANLYRLIDEAQPEDLEHAFAFGGGTAEAGGTMRRGQAHP